MLQLQNETPFAAALSLSPDTDGADALQLAVRATFAMSPRGLQVADEQQEVELTDTYRGEPGRSSLLRAADLHLPKPSTDVVLLGEAWAPGGRPAAQVDVSVTVGPVQKTVRVRRSRVGQRIQSHLRARRSFGCQHAEEGVRRDRGDRPVDPSPRPSCKEPREMGFARSTKDGQPSVRALPNLEDPRSLLCHPAGDNACGLRLPRAHVAAEGAVYRHLRRAMAAAAGAFLAGGLRSALLPDGPRIWCVPGRSRAESRSAS
ncbi:MAG: DUF2169 domain-containing protein [Polyangiaceae bacterium]